MKRSIVIGSLVVSMIIEIVVILMIMNNVSDISQDTVGINRCLKAVETAYAEASFDTGFSDALESRKDSYDDSYSFSILDENEKVVYKNNPKAADSINDAVKNQDTILDITDGGKTVGKFLVLNTTAEIIDGYKNSILWSIITITVIQVLIIIIYLIYLNRRILIPFAKLKDFAARVAAGNLDIPLDMDRGHIFGDFTESFDLMRSELEKARLAEKKANDDKKEVIAKLSHDIKTPVASIKSTSEIGYELAKDAREKELFNTVNIKSDQITTLVDNLFNSSIQDITEIAVSPAEYPSDVVAQAIKNADYMNRANRMEIPSCRVFVDKLRLQQAFDNVFMNSYKYAGTDISVEAHTEPDYLVIRISDSGEGVSAEELPLLTEKYHRGSNTSERDGAGLGLYLTDYFINRMDGYIKLASDNGFSVTFYLRVIS